jgi:ubiquinone/menaquinone biosynthesis C-methylase UbiE
MARSDERYIPALGWDRLTTLYDPVVRFTTREHAFKERLLDQAALSRAADVLDLGCGTGTLAVMAKERAPRANVIGLDGDPKMLERARSKAEAAGMTVRFDEGLSFELPYPDASFDRVMSSLFFHHLDRSGKERTLAEARRVLRPAGELHVADWGRPANPLMRILFTTIRLVDGAESTRDNVEGALPQLFTDAGFEEATVCGNLSTPYGTLAFYSAVSA